MLEFPPCICSFSSISSVFTVSLVFMANRIPSCLSALSQQFQLPLYCRGFLSSHSLEIKHSLPSVVAYLHSPATYCARSFPISSKFMPFGRSSLYYYRYFGAWRDYVFHQFSFIRTFFINLNSFSLNFRVKQQFICFLA